MGKMNVDIFPARFLYNRFLSGGIDKLRRITDYERFEYVNRNIQTILYRLKESLEDTSLIDDNPGIERMKSELLALITERNLKYLGNGRSRRRE